MSAALEAFESIEQRFIKSEDGLERIEFAQALFNKGVTLGALGRSEEAIAAYDDILARFGQAEDGVLRTAVDLAREAKQNLRAV